MKKISAVIISIIITLFTGCGKPDVWNYVGEPNFTPGGMDKISLFAYDGTLYIAFDDVPADDRASVMKFNGSSWEHVGVRNFSDNLASYISLFVSKGIPYTAYIDTALTEQRAYLTQKVMAFNGTEWADVGMPEEISTVENTSFYVEDGTPYLLSRTMGVLKFNGSSWETVGTEVFSSDNTDFVSMCVSDSVPYVIYSDTNKTKKAVVKKMENGRWVKLGDGELSKGEVCATSITIDKGILYAAFVDKGDSGNACVMKYENNKWSHVGKPGFSKGQAYYTTLSAQDGALYLSYTDTKLDPVVLKFSKGKWVNAGTGLPKGQLTFQTIFADKGIIYTAFCKNSTDDQNNYQPKASVMALSPTK
ncbi:MAG: hypothetical protein CVV21_03640 [Candidatus Goldiibacteriota bacterium HGW-Goldbacteria-1]|nr:MAG: hypothetical protein CVV21_03640 [Candidatus Goldiibacteriota bacterium HGW-Goldbacteria-1]